MSRREIERGIQEMRLEYQECNSASRFFVGIRFSFFVSFMTFFVILIGGYQYVWRNQEVFKDLQFYLLIFISFFGLLTTFAALLIEMRNIVLYQYCDKRAAVLEQEMKIWNGVRCMLISPTTKLRLGLSVKHTVAIKILYNATAVIWFILLVHGAYRQISGH